MHRPAHSLLIAPLRRGGRWFVLAAAAVVFLAILPRGRADEITRRIQEELRKRNLYFGDVDGRISGPLSAALHRYQERKGFPSTGEADADTLFSLNILGSGPVPTPHPSTASVPTPTVPPPLDTRESGASWPDITVLRSDEARPGPVPGEAEPAEEQQVARATPMATPAPPPASAGVVRRPSVEQAQDYVTRYLRAGQDNNATAELHFYGEPIAFYDEGTVDHNYIARAVAHYDHRWPERRFAVVGPVTVSNSPDGNPAKFVVNFRLDFNVKNARYSVVGKTDNTWTVSGHDPDSWKIVSMKEQRVREK